VAGSHKEGALGILETEEVGNHSAEARGFKEGGIGSTINIEDKVHVEVLLCPLF
jgi:hypothetical protein